MLNTIIQNRTGEPRRQLVAQLGREALAVVRAHCLEVARTDDPVSALAAAFALGTFVSTIPVPVVDMLLAGLLLRRFQRIPRAPFMAGMALWNNFIMAPIYATTPKVGGYALALLANRTSLVAPDLVFTRLAAGYLIIAAGLVMLSYLVAHTGFAGYRASRR